MDEHFRKKVYKVRPSTDKKGLEISLPGSLKCGGIVQVGDELELV